MPEQGRFIGKVAIVSGGGRGIGRACAKRLASEGAAVAICGRTVSDLEKTVTAIKLAGGRALWKQVDVGDEAAVVQFVDDVVSEFGTVDALLNNASLTAMSNIRAAPLLDMETGEWNRVMGINLSSMFFMTRAAGKVMRAKGAGSIVNVSSVHAFRPNGLYPHYDVAKSGIEGLTRNLALNLGSAGIRVNAIAPGPIDVREPGTESGPGVAGAFEREATALGRTGRTEEVAALVAFLLSDEASYITGVSVPVDGGFLLRHTGMVTGVEYSETAVTE